MKRLTKIIIIMFSVFAAMVCALSLGGIIWRVCYNPLKESDLGNLFQSVESCRKDKSEDLIKMSVHGESYDFFRYRTKGVVLGEECPRFDKLWHGKMANETCYASKWRPTPVYKEDSLLVFSMANTKVDGSPSELQKEIIPLCGSAGSDYSYISSESNGHHLFVYERKSGHLYYIRMNGLAM